MKLDNLTYQQIFEETIKKIRSYYPAADLCMVHKAYRLAVNAHDGQIRKSGEPYMIHPVSVAYILATLKLDIKCITAGLLHDVVEDSDYTVKDLEKMFCKDIANIVDGVTEVSPSTTKSKAQAEAETHQKIYKAMKKDGRVILIKVCDRLHNMRTLNHMARKKQIKKAKETLEIYVPILDRLGIATMKSELEDLCFKYIHPNEYRRLSKIIHPNDYNNQSHIELMIEDMKKHLNKANINFEISSKPRSLYSIYKRTIDKNTKLSKYDLCDFRVIVKTKSDCYNALKTLNRCYKNNNKVKDYISKPKLNNYQSIHDTLLTSKGEPFKTQISTFEMYKISQLGVVANWKYDDVFNHEKFKFHY